jgi:hypothetical protein
MATTPVVLIAAAQLANSVATLYTATRVKGRIDKLTCTNEDTVAHTITFHIVDSGGSASAANRIIHAKSLSAGECYTCPEMIGHWLTDGQTIQGFADTASQVTVRASGIEST